MWPEPLVARPGVLNERQARARQALELLLEDSGADVGHLFLFDEGGLFAAASIDDGPGGAELLAIAEKHIEAEMQKASTDAATVVGEVTATSVASSLTTAGTTAGSVLSPVLLAADSGTALSGLALIGARARAIKAPRSELVQAISRCLLNAGDSIPLVIEE